MLITKEKAQQIADLSYKIYELGLQEKGFITYKKATELDKNTGDKIIEELTSELKLHEMKEDVEIYGGKLFNVGDEIVVVDNYLYLDSIEYEITNMSGRRNYVENVPGDIKCTFSDGSSCTIPGGMKSRMYAPHIYGGIVNTSSGVNGTYSIGSYPSISDTIKRVLYLKMIIAEDRLINPYILIQEGYMGRVDRNYILPMYEATRALSDSEKEIELLNEVIKVCDGNLIVDPGSINISIKASVLYLEGIDRYDLSNKLRAYEKDPFVLNSVIDYAHKGYYGVTFNGGFRKVVLI